MLGEKRLSQGELARPVGHGLVEVIDVASILALLRKSDDVIHGHHLSKPLQQKG